MNVDEAMRCVSAGQNSSRDGYAVLFNLEIGTTLKAEVERLRAEVQRLDITGTHSCHDDCPKLPCVQRREIERLRAELAATKAASVVPVELVALGDADWECSVGVKCKSSEDADRLYNWLRDRTKDTPPTT